MVEIAVRPYCANLIAGVGQHPDENGHRLGIGDLVVGEEAAVTHTGDEGRAGHRGLTVRARARIPADHGGGGQIYIAPGPVLGGHIGENGAGRVEDDLVPQTHKIDRHGAELGAGEDLVGVELVASGAGNHAHQPENVGVEGGVAVTDIGKGGGPGGGDRKGQIDGQCGGQQAVDHGISFHGFVSYLLLCPQGHHRLQSGGLDRGVHAKEDAEHHRKQECTDGNGDAGQKDHAVQQ